MQYVPALDPKFIPFGLWADAYRKGAKKPIAIAIERNEGFISVRDIFIHGTKQMLDADYRYVKDAWTYNNFVGHRWTNVSSDERRLYLKNAYRVLLTRARQGMAIFVPEGSSEDSTRKSEWYDGIFDYLKFIGIPVLE